MVRAFMGKKIVEYTVYCNQGTPNVYFDGMLVGTVSNGMLKVMFKQANKPITVTLSGCSSHGNTSSERLVKTGTGALFKTLEGGEIRPIRNNTFLLSKTNKLTSVQHGITGPASLIYYTIDRYVTTYSYQIVSNGSIPKDAFQTTINYSVINNGESHAGQTTNNVGHVYFFYDNHGQNIINKEETDTYSLTWFTGPTTQPVGVKMYEEGNVTYEFYVELNS